MKPGHEGRKAKERLRVPPAQVALATRMSRCLEGNSSIKMDSLVGVCPALETTNLRQGVWEPTSPSGLEGRWQRDYELGEGAVGAVAPGLFVSFPPAVLLQFPAPVFGNF